MFGGSGMTTPPGWVLTAYRRAADLTAEAKALHARHGTTDTVLKAYRLAAEATAEAHTLHTKGNTHA